MSLFNKAVNEPLEHFIFSFSNSVVFWNAHAIFYWGTVIPVLQRDLCKPFVLLSVWQFNCKQKHMPRWLTCRWLQIFLKWAFPSQCVRLGHPLPREAFTSSLLCTSFSHCLNAGTADLQPSYIRTVAPHFSLRFTFLTLFYISLGKATVPVRINIIISLGRRVFLEGWFFFFSLWRSVCSSPPFLVVLATAIKLKLQEVEGLPCLLLRRRESCGLRYRLTCGIHRVAALLWVRSRLSKPFSPLPAYPSHPHYKISAHFQTNHCIHIFRSLGFTQLPQSAFRLLKWRL